MVRVTYCLNGHRVSRDEPTRISRPSMTELVRMIERDRVESYGPRQKFCDECGAKTLNACEKCHEAIRGAWKPAYCGSCGNPFPWTESALEVAKDYADELEELTPAEKATLKASIDDLTIDTPRTEYAAHRFKKLMAKVGPVAGELFKKVVVEVGTEAAKKWTGL